MSVAELSPTPGWRARLELTFEQRGARTILAARRHEGPLVVQRAFYPEPDGTCHLYVLHPPGGVAGGDDLEIAVDAKSGRALLTTPAATKIYRTKAPESRVVQTLRVRSGALLEWLPQETIVFGGAAVRALTKVELEPGARFVGWEITCLGRPASGDEFASGRLDQRVELWQDGRPLLLDRLLLDASAPDRAAGWGWGGRSVYGCLFCSSAPPGLVDALRNGVRPAAAGELFAVTNVADVAVCRYLGSSGERARRTLSSAWGIVRKHVLDKSVSAPRIWAT